MVSKIKWSEKEELLLTRVWESFERNQIIKLFPDRSWKSLQKKAERLNLRRERLSHRIVNENQCKMSPSWLLGELLGDGCITKEGKYAHTTKYKDYAEFLKIKLTNLGLHVNLYENYNFDKRTSQTYYRVFVATRVRFKDLRKKWYPDGKKRVPQDLEINDDIFCHWMLGDGTINPKKSSFLLCTMGFGNECLRYLEEKLDKYGISCNIQKDGNIYLCCNSRTKETIKKAIEQFNCPDCYKYKIQAIRQWLK